MSSYTFRITFLGSVSLTTEEVWPDDDAPEHPTARDVIEKMRSYSKSEMLREWNLENDLDIIVFDEKGRTESWEGP